MRWCQNSAEDRYLKPNRLSDVLALIQVLALDEHSHRSEDGITSELQGPPRSGQTWAGVATEHAEFFRVRAEGTHRISLVARHVTPKDENDLRVLPADYAGRLMQLAVDLHDRQLQRSQRWHVYLPILVAVTAGVFTLFGIVLKGWLGGAS